MRKEIDIEIPYFERGKELTKTVKVGFVSNRVVRDYSGIMKRLNTSFNYYGEIKKLNQKIADIVVDKKLNFLKKRAESKQYTDQIIEIKKKIKESDEEQLLIDRFDLIKRILEDNGCEDKELLSIKFWDNKTDTVQSWAFLASAVTKDQAKESKKKSHMTSTKIY